MNRFFWSVALATLLGGCASLNNPLPKCDGQARRPLNRAMWQWDENRNLKSHRPDTRSPMSALPYVEQSNEPAGFSQLNVVLSHRSCAG